MDDVNGPRRLGGPHSARFHPGYLVWDCGYENLVSITLIGRSAAVRIRVSDAAFMDDLESFFRAAECEVTRLGTEMVDVSMPRAPSDSQALREISIYLRTWQAMHPGAHARVVGERGGEPGEA